MSARLKELASKPGDHWTAEDTADYILMQHRDCMPAGFFVLAKAFKDRDQGRALSAQASAEPVGYAQTRPAAFKNFHRSLCARFGYTHDEEFWWRDLVSLEEWIERQVATPRAAGPVVPEVTEDMIYATDSYMTPSKAREVRQILEAAFALLATSAPSEPVEQAWISSRRGALLSAAAGVSELYRNHCHHHGVDGLLNRCKQLEQVFIADADTDATSERSAHQTVIDYHAAFNGDVGALMHASAPLLPSEPKRVELTEAEFLALKEVIRISDRKHDAWEAMHAFIASHEAKLGGGAQ